MQEIAIDASTFPPETYILTYRNQKVPLWVASNLRQRQKCRILAPDWMTVDVMEELKEAEKESPGEFQT